MPTKLIKVDYLARVEGEGALTISASDGKVDEVKVRIFEPPRLFESFLVGRSFEDLPDMTARICGICPVAYQMSCVNAAENAFGTKTNEAIRQLRRLYLCGEWLESHTLHVFMLAAPDFLGFDSVIALSKVYPAMLQRGLAIKRLGNDIVCVLGGREIHPVSTKVGGFHGRPPTKSLKLLQERLERAKEEAVATVKWVAGFDLPDNSRDTEFVSLSHPHEYPMNEGRLVSNKGLNIAVTDFEQYFAEKQVPYSNALHTTTRAGTAYFVGPLARVNLNFDKLTPDAQSAARDSGVPFPNSNSFTSIVARAIEIVHALDEAAQIVANYDESAVYDVGAQPQAKRGYGICEAPRGVLYHRYDFDQTGLIQKAIINPPTAQNQLQIEEDLRDYVPKIIDLPLAEATRQCETLVRNYDPCISCATH